MNLWLTRWMLERVNARIAPTVIHMGGNDEKLAKRDFFSLQLSDKEGLGYLFRGRNDGGYHFSRFNRQTDQFDLDTYLDVDEVAGMDMLCEFYIGAHQFNYHSKLRMFLSLQLRTWFISIKIDGLIQWLFNSRSLRSAARLELMRYLGDKALADPRFRATPFTWHTAKHGKRVWRRSDVMELLHREKMMLNALVDTGDLRVDANGGYEILPRLLNSLDAAETDDRRHTKNVRIQLYIGMVALIAAAASITQAYEAWLQSHNTNHPAETIAAPVVTSPPGKSVE
jgi:hypothetical protein